MAKVDRVDILPHGSLGTATACNFDIQSTTGSVDATVDASVTVAVQDSQATSNLAIVFSAVTSSLFLC